MKKSVLIIALLLTAYLTSVGQALSSSRAYVSDEETAVAGDVITQNFSIYYRLDKINLDPTYLDNPRQIKHIINYLQNSPRIDSITIYSWASPEGPYYRNKWLSRERGKTAKRFLLEHTQDSTKLNSDKIKISPIAENWAGLLELVEENYTRADRDEVLRILTDQTIGDETRKARLKKLDGGRTWKYFLAHYMPQLRAATWVCVWAQVPQLPANTRALENLRSKAVVDVLAPSTPPIYPVQIPLEGRKIILALKTNMLYDILSWTNFSVEVPFWKDNMSVLYYHQFPWWTWGQADNEFCNRFLSIGAEARWWFLTKDRLNGHFLGLYSESGKYDFEYQRSICYQGEFYSAGLSYGYAMPIGRHLNLEFSLSAGYASIAYRGYTPSEDYEILWRDPNKVGRLHYFGPTKAQVSLVIPIRVKTKGGNAL